MRQIPGRLNMDKAPASNVKTSAPARGSRPEGAVLLRASGLSKAFGSQVVLDGVDLELRQGEVVILRGFNGSGKSTLLNILSANLEPDSGVLELGVNGARKIFRFPSRWWQKLGLKNEFIPEFMFNKGFGRTWQDIRLFSTLNLCDNIAAAIPGQMGENPWLAVGRFATVKRQERTVASASQEELALLGLREEGRMLAEKLSVGHAKCVAIARAVRAGAKVLCLDEPLAGVDNLHKKKIVELLRVLAQREHLTLVIIEHSWNISQILGLATTIWTLEGGKLRVEQPSKAGSPPVNEVSESDIQQLGRTATLTSVRVAGKEASKPFLEVDDLVVYRGRRLIVGDYEGAGGKIKGVSFTLRQPGLYHLHAPNAWGASTLIEAIAGLIPVARGRIHLNGENIESLPPWQRVSAGVRVALARANGFQSLTVREMFDLAQVRSLPEGFSPLLAKQMSSLSGGERQKVVLWSILHGPEFQVGVFDEPFMSLDAREAERIGDELSRLASEKIILITVPASTGSTEEVIP